MAVTQYWPCTYECGQGVDPGLTAAEAAMGRDPTGYKCTWCLQRVSAGWCTDPMVPLEDPVANRSRMYGSNLEPSVAEPLWPSNWPVGLSGG